MKTGVKTSEFYGTIAVILTLVINKYFSWNIPEGTMLEIVAAMGGYVLSRGIAKKGK